MEFSCQFFAIKKNGCNTKKGPSQPHALTLLSLHLGVGPVHDDEVEARGDERQPEQQVQRAGSHEQGVPAAAGQFCRLGRRGGRPLEDADGGEGGEAEVEAVRRRPAAQGAEGEN